jgi:hypothetical protein
MADQHAAEGVAAPALRVRAVTWNVGELDGSYYEPHMLVPLLLGSTATTRGEVDIVAVGLQEAEMSVGSFLSAGVAFSETEKGAKWTESFRRALATHNLVRVSSCQLMGLHLSVWAHATVAARVVPGSPELASASCGLMGAGFNKGAIAVRLQLGGLSWLFVNCHLAAG